VHAVQVLIVEGQREGDDHHARELTGGSMAVPHLARARVRDVVEPFVVDRILDAITGGGTPSTWCLPVVVKGSRLERRTARPT
jgi:hypothetical protein